MIPMIEERSAALEELCRRYPVARLELFGSAAAGGHSEASDIDFIVEFQPRAFDAYAEVYFGLLEDLERLFGCSVDLVVHSAIKNPYFLQSVEQTRTLIYEA